MRLLFFVLLFCPILAIAQTPCENGYAGAYPCENVDLIYHITPADIGGATTNEVWGWTDPLDQKEYILLGASTGLFFFDMSMPTAPLQIGFLPTHTTNSSWRTFRTYQNFVFVCSEASGHGMQVFDLTRLRDVQNPPEIFTEDAHYSNFGNCHTLAICEEVGYAYACGTGTYSGGLHIVNIQDPLNPVLAGGYELNGSTHESSVVVYNGPDQDYIGHTVAFCYNGAVPFPVTIVDVTDPLDASTISLSTYPQKRYCHQGWLTEDGGYMLIDDELDEYFDLVDSLHTIILDVHDLDAPTYMGYHVGGSSIDHNQIVIGNLCYQSNYTAGLSLLDVTEIADTTLRQVGYFDHYPANDNQVFQGEWMSYPYFESGVIPVTDIYNGLFLLKPSFVHASAADTTCSSELFAVSLELKDGFPGPYSFSFVDLPIGVNPVYDLTGVAAPTTVEIEFENTLGLSGDMHFQIIISGQFNTYEVDINSFLIAPLTWFSDIDGDGFGVASSDTLSCNHPDGFAAVAGDCQQDDNSIFPGASGTWDDLDNDCNGIVEEDELEFCADLNGDHIITVADVQLLIGNLFCSGQDCFADLNNDGMTGITDLLILMADFGEDCP